jgi:hypothetical protein
VPVDGTQGDAGGVGELTNGDLICAYRLEHLQQRVEDLLVRLQGLGLTQRGLVGSLRGHLTRTFD